LWADKSQAIKKLHEIAAKAEKDFAPNNNFEKLIEKEREDSWKYGAKRYLEMLSHQS